MKIRYWSVFFLLIMSLGPFAQSDRLLYSIDKKLIFYSDLLDVRDSLESLHKHWPRHIIFDLFRLDKFFFKKLSKLSIHTVSQDKKVWRKLFDLEVFQRELEGKSEVSVLVKERGKKELTLKRNILRPLEGKKRERLQRLLTTSFYLQFRYNLSHNSLSSKVIYKKRIGAKERGKSIKIGQEYIKFSLANFKILSFF